MATLPSQSSHHESEEILQGPIFSPPVYRQRYEAVLKLSRKLHPKKVLNFTKVDGLLSVISVLKNTKESTDLNYWMLPVVLKLVKIVF